jgi:hypothetical protein
MTATDSPTKVTAFMTPASMEALGSAADRLGLSRTDTMNRAIQVYELLLAAKPDDVLVFGNPDGSSVVVGVGR